MFLEYMNRPVVFSNYLDMLIILLPYVIIIRFVTFLPVFCLSVSGNIQIVIMIFVKTLGGTTFGPRKNGVSLGILADIQIVIFQYCVCWQKFMHSRF